MRGSMEGREDGRKIEGGRSSGNQDMSRRCIRAGSSDVSARMHVNRRRGYQGDEDGDGDALERCSVELGSRVEMRIKTSGFILPTPPFFTHLPPSLTLSHAYLPNRNLNSNLIAPRRLGPRLLPRAHQINLQHVPAHAHTVLRDGAPEDDGHEVVAERALREVRDVEA
jgi:hypothetical protein